MPLLIFFSAVRVVVGRRAPGTGFCWPHLRCGGTTFAPVFGTPQPCLRRILPKSAGLRPSPLFAGRTCGARAPVLPRCSEHRNRASGGPFFSALPEKNGEKRGALGRVDFYRSTTTEAPKFVTSCKRTSSPARNYPLHARQSDSPNLPLAASEAVPTMPPAQKPRTLSRVRRNCPT